MLDRLLRWMTNVAVVTFLLVMGWPTATEAGPQIGEPQGHVKVEMPRGEGSSVRVTKCRSERVCRATFRVTPRGNGRWVIRRTR